MTSLANIFSNQPHKVFFKETAAYVVAGLLGTRLVQDLTWKSTGLLLGSINALTIKAGNYLSNKNELNTWSKNVMKVISVALAIILAKQVVPMFNLSISSDTTWIVAGLSLITNIALDYFEQASSKYPSLPTAKSASPASTEEPQTALEINYEGMLLLPNSQTWYGVNTLLKGIFHWIYTKNFEEGASKDVEDTYFYMHFPPTKLVRENGSFLKDSAKLPDVAIMELIQYSNKSEAREKVKLAVQAFMHTHSKLPSKLIVPIGGCAHIACLIIEPNEEDCLITALDSIGSNSSYGWREATEGAKLALQTFYKADGRIKTICNHWSQNNLMKCGVHVMKNIVLVAEYPGLIFDLITKANQTGIPPLQFVPRNAQDLISFVKEMKAEMGAYFGKVLDMNPGRVYLKTDRANIPIAVKA